MACHVVSILAREDSRLTCRSSMSAASTTSQNSLPSCSMQCRISAIESRDMILVLLIIVGH